MDNEGEKAPGDNPCVPITAREPLVSLMLHVPNPKFDLCGLERITLQIGAPSEGSSYGSAGYGKCKQGFRFLSC